jgi:hypothetical protein
MEVPARYSGTELYQIYISPDPITLSNTTIIYMKISFKLHIEHATNLVKSSRNFLFSGPLNSFGSSYLFYLLTAGVEVLCHLITLRHTPQSVGLLWTRDRPVAENSTWQHKHSQETNIHAPGGIRTRDPSKHSATDLRLRRRGHGDACWITK